MTKLPPTIPVCDNLRLSVTHRDHPVQSSFSMFRPGFSHFDDPFPRPGSVLILPEGR
ncbi:uncharacterized protein SCHCODRAFT_02623467 [Schizophyllum commune H4-8]|uniref:uncharacterized protein n=1 Tax=Schizophyllum commune (strain H4-8 / FGSC 9210) TaxID=578458 RepID=UPI00215E965B|nr:uncharacterized protein SCHCODRAFT_02623467 [Schizophyllum commune H4-8]KAI5894019.1 hypothetical protein SCHCODRAFT_02623467 [Schizophyllum commune H4-8]